MNGHAIALWAALAAFFGTILALGAIDIFNPSDQLQFISGVFVGAITGAAVYSRQRLEDAKEGRTKAGVMRITEVGDKRVFTLELDSDPVIFVDKKEVSFKVEVQKAGDE